MKSNGLQWVLYQYWKKNLFNKDIIEIREECGGGEPGDGEQKEKEANNADTHVTCFLVWPRATPDSQKQLFHKDKSISTQLLIYSLLGLR